MAPKSQKFLLHFLMHIDVLMLCSKFQLFPTSIFLSFKNGPKSLYYSPWIFAKNGSEITKKFYYIFLYILMYLCCVASLSCFRLQFFEFWPSLKMGQNPCTIAHGFLQKMAPKSQNFFITFSYTY